MSKKGFKTGITIHHVSLFFILVVCLLLRMSPSHAAVSSAARLFVPPTNQITVSPSDTADKSQEINRAIKRVRAMGGGTVYLPPGVYQVGSPLIIGTDINENNMQQNAKHVRLLGAMPVNSFSPGKTTLVWTGSRNDQAVIDVTHAQNTTIENLTISGAKNTRFRYGIFFHRTDSAANGVGHLLAPSALNVINTGISPGQGAFTVGIRLNNSSDDLTASGSIDQNVDHNYLENVYISGATDDNGGTPDNLLDGLNSAGIMIDGSQVQGQYFHDLHIRNSGTGIFVRDGQLQLFSGEFRDNIQPGPGPEQSLADDNQASNGDPAGRGGGDIVLRSGYGAGHVIQDVTSNGSYRFLSSFLEDQDSSPHSGVNNVWQGDFPLALAIMGCHIETNAHPAGEAVFIQGNGGPVSFVGCEFGVPSEPKPLVIAAGRGTYAAITVVKSRFNHTTEPFFKTITPTGFETTIGPPQFTLLASTGWDGTTNAPLTDIFSDPAARRPEALDIIWPRARSLREKPQPLGDFKVDLSKPFVFRKVTYKARYGAKDYLFDNAPVIQAAINKISQESPKQGGTIWFPNGIFTVRSTIRLSKTHHIRLQGIGGRSGAGAINDELPVVGTALAWNGSEKKGSTMLIIDGSHHIAIGGIFFSTLAKPGEPGGAMTVDTMIHISEKNGQTSDVWIEDVGAGWMGGVSNVRNRGVCNSFVRIGDGTALDGPERITLTRFSTQYIAGQGILVDGRTRDVQILLYTNTQSKHAIKTSAAGGEFTWLGGGGGNNLVAFDNPDIPDDKAEASFEDPTAVYLEGASGPIAIAGLEFQDIYPTRGLRTSRQSLIAPTPDAGRVTVYGTDWLFNAPPGDRQLINFSWRKSPKITPTLYLIGSQLGTRSDNGAEGFYAFTRFMPQVSATESSVVSIGNSFYHPAGEPTPWNGPAIEDIGSRSINNAPGTTWPNAWQVEPYFHAPAS